MITPNDNSVELIGTYGGDMAHALSAWTSTSRELTDTKIEPLYPQAQGQQLCTTWGRAVGPAFFHFLKDT